MGRYNAAGDGPTQYLSLHPLTPWAEMLRGEDVREEEAAAELRPPLWTVRVPLEDALTLDFDAADRFGLEAGDLVADRFDACQALARAFRKDPDGPSTLIVPSAALPGTRNVVVFGERVGISYLDEPVDEIDVPVSLAAERGIATRGLLAAIHYRDAGTEHEELAAWRAGRGYRFTEPVTTHLGSPS